MKRIKAACITQTLCFSNHDGETTEYAKKAIVQECEKYKAQLIFHSKYSSLVILPDFSSSIRTTHSFRKPFKTP